MSPGLELDRVNRFVRLRPLLGPVFAVVLFAIALSLLQGELRGDLLADIVRQVRGTAVSTLAIAGVLTVLSYSVFVGYDLLGLRYVGHPLPLARVALVSFVSTAFSTALGFPLLTGGPVRFRLYSMWGVPLGAIAKTLAFWSLTFWLGVAMITGVVCLASPTVARDMLHLPLPLVGGLGGSCLALVGAYVVWSVRGGAALELRGVEIRRPTPRLVAAQLAVACADWIAAAAVLYWLMPARLELSFLPFVGAFTLAFVAGLVSHVPGGLGVFESVLLLLVPDAAQDPAVLGALAVFRLVYYVAPLLTAAALLGAYEVARQRHWVGKVAGTAGRLVPDIAPRLLAVTTFVAGAILLISGATPPTTTMWSRLAIDLLPVPVLDASQLLASSAGVGLMLLASGLQRRLDAAWHLTIGLLLSGLLFSVLRGHDWETGVALGVMVVALLPSHRHFTRKAALLAEPFTPGWVAAICIVVLTGVYIATFAFAHAEYSTERWWSLAADAHAPTVWRTTIGAAVVLGAVALARLLRSVDPVSPTLTAEEMTRAAATADRVPDTKAHLAKLGDKRLLFGEDATSMLMYDVAGQSCIALGDPHGSLPERIALAERFVTLAHGMDRQPVFYQTSAPFLPIYVDLGLQVYKIGEEARVWLPDFSLDGGQRKWMRRVLNALDKVPVTFNVVPQADVPPMLPELRRISDDWLKRKRTREKKFSLGNFTEAYVGQFPQAVVMHEGRICAFANVWSSGDREELSVDLMRFDGEAPPNTMDYLMINLMRWGRANGYRWMNLGMAPLSGLEPQPHSPMLHRAGHAVFRLGEGFFNFKGLRAYKEKFHPTWEARYLAAPSSFGLARAVADIASLISGGIVGTVIK